METIKNLIETDIEIFEKTFDDQLAELMQCDNIKSLIQAHMKCNILLRTAYQFNIISLTAFNYGFDQALDQFNLRLDEIIAGDVV